MSAQAASETERNFVAFRSMLPSLLEHFKGKFALMHAERVEQYFDNPADAVVEGLKRFGRGEYSVQEVTDSVESLGFYSYAGGSVQA